MERERIGVCIGKERALGFGFLRLSPLERIDGERESEIAPRGFYRVDRGWMVTGRVDTYSKPDPKTKLYLQKFTMVQLWGLKFKNIREKFLSCFISNIELHCTIFILEIKKCIVSKSAIYML